jgi:predicted P-loop ATPase
MSTFAPNSVDAIPAELSCLAREGWRLFPCRPRGKSPLVTDWPSRATSDETQLREWANEFSSCNWACATGAESGVFVIDCDGATGLCWLQDRMREVGDTWATRQVKTSRGVHLYFRWPENGATIRNSTSKLANHVDVRGEGGYALLPGSVHPDGTVYEWIGSPDTPVKAAPADIIALAKAASRELVAMPTPVNGNGRILAGARNSTLTSLAGSMRRKGASEASIAAALEVENKTACTPPLAMDEVATIAASVSRYEPERDWRARLLLSKNGSPQRVLANACIALREAPELAGLLGYDEFAGVTVTRRPAPWKAEQDAWTEDDDRHLAEWLQMHGIGVPTKIAAEAAETVARENPFHPVKLYLEALSWDGTERIDLWMPVCLGAEDTPYTRAVGARILIAAAARIYAPGCQADSLPVLIGPQGIMKSSVIRELFSSPWFSDHISDLHSKDARVELRGKWCIEISELSAMRRGEIESVKAYISCRVDSFRPPYGVRRIDVARSCIFFGTTNDLTPLTDPTGNRRFWPVRCGVIDLEAVRTNRDQLWAEALFRYKRGDQWYLETPELTALAKEAQACCYEVGGRDDLIAKWIENPQQRTPAHEWDEALPWFGSQVGKINITDVLIHGLGLTQAQIRPGDSREIGRCLRHLGYECTQERSGAHRGLRYYTKWEGEQG